MIEMTIAVDLSSEQTAKLNEAARQAGVEPAVLLARIADQYFEHKGAFETAAGHVLQKNAELYRRLAK